MGCCVSRIINKKVDPVPDSVNTVALRPSPSRPQRIPRRENVVVHRSVEGTYNVLASIGRGAFGHVVRVEHMKTKKPYAIKIIDLRKNAAKHEIEILKTVNHCYVIKLHEVITTPGKLYLVMDLATGGELFDRIHLLGKFDENDAIHVLRMILEGIHYLHSVGITHRDLKPENILYYHPGNDSSIIITDFGLAAIRKPPNSLMNTDCGTVEYMAPEVIVRDPYTNTVDMWSIGVITYILLSGKLPFPIRGNPIKGNMFSLLRTICFGKFSYEGQPWQSISAEAKDFINSLLIVEPKKRLTASEALEHRWIKERQRSRKRNLQRSISSNWTESCLSLNSVLSKNGRTRNHKDSKERVNVNENRARASKNHGSTAKKVSKVRTNAVYDTIDSECQASDATKRSVETSHRRNRDHVSKTSVEASAKKYIHAQATKECAEGEDTSSSGCCKNDATERTLLKEHVGNVENRTQISRGVAPS